MLKQIVIVIAILPLAHILYLNRVISIKENLNYIGLPQKQLSSTGNLLHDNGTLIESGWSNKQLKKFDSSKFSTWQTYFRYKKWDYYQISTEEIFFAIAFADIGYAQNIQISFMNIETQNFIYKDKILLPLIDSKPTFSDSIYITEDQFYSYESRNLIIHYEGKLIDNKKEQRYLNITLIHENNTLEVNLRLDSNTNHDRIILHQPINRQRTQFFYNAKSYNWMAKGTIMENDKKFEIMQSMSNGGLDWGRGIWNYHTFWMWASVQGFLRNGKRFALNLGGGFQDEKAVATEDSVFYDRKLMKLQDIEYNYDLDQIEKPIIMKTKYVEKDNFERYFGDKVNAGELQQYGLKEGYLYCEFVPDYLNSKTQDFLVIKMKFKQLFGYFYGAFVNEDGKVHQFEKLYGMIEFNHANW